MKKRPPVPFDHQRQEDSAIHAAIQHQQMRRRIAANTTIRFDSVSNLSIRGHPPSVLLAALSEEPADKLGLILHSSEILVLGDKGGRGEQVLDTTPTFWKLLEYAVENGPQSLHELLPKDGRLFEEFIAGVYSESGYKMVELSAQSGDGGVDVWAIYEVPGAGNVTIMDQVKLYGPKQKIESGDVLRILAAENRGIEFSKAVLSTTGHIPPVVRKETADYGERVILRDADVLKEVFDEILGRDSRES